MSKKIKISIDLEGPLGMYPYINNSKSLEKYFLLDEFINYLINFHKNNKKSLTIGILGLTALNEVEDLINIVSSINIDYPKNSLINKIKNDSSFFKLVVENKKIFFKGNILENLKIRENKYLNIACHSLSHVHIFEGDYTSEILDIEIKSSLNILEKFTRDSEKINLFIAPRNQINNSLIEILNKYKIKKIRNSSLIRLYSENHDANFLLKYYFKFLRKYDKYNLPLSRKINKSPIKKKFSVNDTELIDSGYFLDFPKNSFVYKRYLKSFKNYIYEKLKHEEDINIWFHPHNMLNNINLSKDYYADCHKILSSIIKYDYKFHNL